MSDLKLLIHSRTRYRDTPIKKIKIGITMYGPMKLSKDRPLAILPQRFAGLFALPPQCEYQQFSSSEVNCRLSHNYGRLFPKPVLRNYHHTEQNYDGKNDARNKT
jgi:hypothetical protein